MRIIKYRGFTIELSGSLLLLVPFILYDITEFIAILVTISLHELAHFVGAKLTGTKIEKINIFVFGCILETTTDVGLNLKKDIIVSALGPISNIILVLVLNVLPYDYSSNAFISVLIKYNLYMAGLNILPLLPLDGGRIARALVSCFLGYKTGSLVVVYFTYFICMVMIIISLYAFFVYNIGLMMIVLLMIYIIKIAHKEKTRSSFYFISNLANRKNILMRKKVLKAYIIVSYEDVKVNKILNKLLPMRYHIIIVINKSGKVIGTLSEEELIESVFKQGFDVIIRELLLKRD
ncbi:hypothetical protein PV797_14300 [Clostridiaceae bacterium M8S5]|nr:hypothetical protein PV797_14300 [Clostridiaceae bacterium M8S5]